MDTLEQYYVTQTALLQLQRQQETLEEELRQAKFDLREADQALTEYESGLCAFLERFTGKAENSREILRRRIREAEAKHDSLLRQRERLTAQLEQARMTLASLPSSEELFRQADPKHRAELEAALCAEALRPLLEQSQAALTEYRSLLRGEYPFLSVDRQQEIASEPHIRAEQCQPWLQRLEKALEILEEPFAPGSYYASPAAYLANVAARHNRLDRANHALDQTQQLQNRIRHL